MAGPGRRGCDRGAGLVGLECSAYEAGEGGRALRVSHQVLPGPQHGEGHGHQVGPGR